MAVWAIVPAAGIGARMNSELPKQYLPLAGKSVIACTLARLAQVQAIRAIVVALHAADRLWQTHGMDVSDTLMLCAGGAERASSVLNGLEALAGLADTQDWVLVHDAVRPCVRVADIEALLQEIATHPVGGLLGIPLTSTLKLADVNDEVLRTIPREAMWQASTPQAFRYGALRDALEQAIARGDAVTDEAGAMELAGYKPRLLRCAVDNIKITYPEDLLLASSILQAQAQEFAH